MQLDRTRPVIVAVGLGPRSIVGLRQGYEEAARAGSPLFVIHVQRRTRARPTRGDVVRTSAVDRVHRLVQDLPATRNTRIVLRGGKAVDQIVDLARSSKARLVVITNDSLELGSVTRSLVREAPCPVLVARDAVCDGPVIAATDLSDPSLPTIRAAAAFAVEHGAPLHAIHVVEPWARDATIAAGDPASRQRIELLSAQLGHAVERVGARATLHTPIGLPSIEVTKLARSIDSRLVVIGAADRAPMWRFAIGSVGEDIVRWTPSSVLVTRVHPH